MLQHVETVNPPILLLTYDPVISLAACRGCFFCCVPPYGCTGAGEHSCACSNVVPPGAVWSRTCCSGFMVMRVTCIHKAHRRSMGTCLLLLAIKVKMCDSNSIWLKAQAQPGFSSQTFTSFGVLVPWESTDSELLVDRAKTKRRSTRAQFGLVLRGRSEDSS